MFNVYAKYTVVLKNLLDDENAKEKINKALSTYPMYTPKNQTNFTAIPTREELNKRILDHYKYREIGFETVGRFIDELEIAMCEIMPYYNQLFKSEDIINEIEDVFGNIDITETFEQETTNNATSENSGETTSNSSTTNNGTNKTTSNGSENITGENENNTNSQTNETGKQISSEQPQSELALNDVDSVKYADNAIWNKKNNTNNTTSNGTNSTNTTTQNTINGETSETATGENKTNVSATGTEERTGKTKHTLTRKGNQGVNTYAHDMKELREIFLNITNQIINDKKLQILFMQVY